MPCVADLVWPDTFPWCSFQRDSLSCSLWLQITRWLLKWNFQYIFFNMQKMQVFTEIMASKGPKFQTKRTCVLNLDACKWSLSSCYRAMWSWKFHRITVNQSVSCKNFNFLDAWNVLVWILSLSKNLIRLAALSLLVKVSWCWDFTRSYL